MPQRLFGRFAVVAVVLVGVVAVCGLTVQGLIKTTSPAEEIECTESDHRLAEQLAGDPVLTSPPHGTTLGRIEQFPCGDDSDPTARYVTADIGLPPGTSMDSVLDHYRTLLTVGRWRIALEPPPPSSCQSRCLSSPSAPGVISRPTAIESRIRAALHWIR